MKLTSALFVGVVQLLPRYERPTEDGRRHHKEKLSPPHPSLWIWNKDWDYIHIGNHSRIDPNLSICAEKMRKRAEVAPYPGLGEFCLSSLAIFLCDLRIVERGDCRQWRGSATEVACNFGNKKLRTATGMQTERTGRRCRASKWSMHLLGHATYHFDTTMTEMQN